MRKHPTDPWEDLYHAAGDTVFGTAPTRFVRDNPWLAIPGGTALSVADGEGRNSVHLARAGMRVQAFDPSPTAVARARALAHGENVPLDARVSDWDDWDWAGSFDLVLGIFIQFAPPAFRARQFVDMARALRPDGRLVLHGYTPDQVTLGTGGPTNPRHLYTPELLTGAFAGWRIERLATYECDLNEGRVQSGRSALIDFVARKP